MDVALNVGAAPQIREQMSGPDLHVITLKFLALKNPGFSTIENTSQICFAFLCKKKVNKFSVNFSFRDSGLKIFRKITAKGWIPMLVKVTNMGAELQSQNSVDVCYGKTFGLGA